MGSGPAPYLPIRDYGLIGNLCTAALVGTNGSVDWCCMPLLDSPSVFGAILDHRRGGRFRVHARGAGAARQRYLPGTNVLESRFHAPGGELVVTDFMPLRGRIRGRPEREAAPELYRILGCTGDEVEVEVEWAPRPGYAREAVRIEQVAGGFVARSGNGTLSLGGVPDDGAEVVHDGYGPVVRARLTLRGGEGLALATRFGEGRVACTREEAAEKYRETVRAWRSWVHVCDPGGACAFAGPYHERTVRSALLLKLLTQAGTGAIAAAPTTSLPEEVGGVRNWDYRFCWVRDSALTAQALFAVGHREEARNFLHWIEEVSLETGDRGYDLQILYGLHGKADLREVELPHLEGYRGSRPVRIGNGAAGQRQLDIYGELVGAAYEWARMGGRIVPRLWSFLAAVADRACEAWRLPDHGIWEVRSEPRHFLHSKLMVWVALDRAVRLAEQYRLPAPLRRWRRERAAVRRAILSDGYDRASGSFVRALGSRELDASTLLIPVVDFLPPDDPRVQGTIDRVMEHLMEDGLVYRYHAEDGLPGGEGAFLLCTFWLVDALTLSGRLGEARELFGAMAERAGPLGLYPEEIAPGTGEFRGNFPQAFSHVGFINSALYLARAEGRRAPAPAPMGSRGHEAETGHRPGAAV